MNTPRHLLFHRQPGRYCGYVLRSLLLSLLLCLFANVCQAQLASGNKAPSSGVGRITLAEGDARVVDGSNHSRTAKVGDSVNENETLITGDGGEIHLTLSDGSVQALRANTRLLIVQVRLGAGPKEGITLTMVKGALRSITGWLGRRTPERVIYRTPTATIGIRGTDHEILVLPKNAKEGQPGSYDKVNAGATVLRNAQGAVAIGPGQAAYAAPKAAPQLLAEVPALFRPSRNEQRLEGLDAALAKTAASNPAATSTAAGSADGKASAGGKVKLQGNTQIKASTSNTTATAVGQNNTAKNQAGVIGGE